MPADTDNGMLVNIPREDAFGCSRLVINSSSQAEQAEVYSSHNFLDSYEVPALPDGRKAFAISSLRTKGMDTTIDYLDLML
jgi:hypothetical protein